MARWEFKLPDIGEGVTEGEIVGWCEGVVVGATIKADAPLVDVLTDKATVTITSPRGGKILELGGAVGQIVEVGSNLVVLELAEGDAAPPPQTHSHHDAPSKAAPKAAPAAPPRAAPAPVAAAPKDDGPAATAVGDIKETLPGMGGPRAAAPTSAPAPVALAPATPAPAASAEPSERPLATPATRKLARDLAVDLRGVAPTGPNGRITSDDVQRAAAAVHAPPPAATASAASAPSSALAPAHREPIKIVAPTPAQAALEEREPLRGVRKKIFEQMGRSKQTAAHFTFVEECDVTALKELRARLRPGAEKQGVKLTFLPFIIKATVAALKRHPQLNSAFDESTGEIVRRKYYNIGIASSTEAGLMVPVIKDCDRRSLLDLAREVQRLGEATKTSKVRMEDLQGSTFTITSLGQQGGLFATPILNTPEVGILGVHQMKRKPVVRGDEITIGEVMLLSLSFDHRLIDGHVGAAFAYEVIRYLEDPDQLFLES